jgi:FtsZ-binding cell division protein ZapB
MAAAREAETDTLASLEERIGRAVELVTSLRRENQELTRRLEALQAERDDALGEVKSQTAKMQQELEELRAERKQVRSRIEKLLGQMDLLSA